jgi:NitT/TauT family transport system ATP-binding protein
MDEPFAALDAQMRQILQEELLALWQADRRTVLFITHSLEEAILLGDRVLVMSSRPGRIIADIAVPFERPRSNAIRESAEFAAMTAQLWKLLRAEVDVESVDHQTPTQLGDGHAVIGMLHDGATGANIR